MTKAIYWSLRLAISAIVGYALGWVDAHRMVKRAVSRVSHPSNGSPVRRPYVFVHGDRHPTRERLTRTELSEFLKTNPSGVIYVIDDEENIVWHRK